MRKFTLALAVLLTPALLSVPAFAADVGDGTIGQPGAGRYSIERVLGAIEDLVDVMGHVFAVMVSNPLFVVFLAAGLFALGVRIFRKVKRAAKG